MKHIYKLLIIFLLLGIYVDVQVDNYHGTQSVRTCNGLYEQQVIVIQTVIPFRPERETFFFGYTHPIYGANEKYSVCRTYDYDNDEPFDDTIALYRHWRYYHFINLRYYF